MGVTALLTSDNKQVQVTHVADRVAYRIDLYPSSTVSVKYWIENNHSYTALLIAGASQPIIKVSSDLEDLNYGNVIFGSASPPIAYANALNQLNDLEVGAPSLSEQIATNALLEDILIKLGGAPSAPAGQLRYFSEFNLANSGIELSLLGRVRRMTINSRSQALLFLQIYDKAGAVNNGDTPLEIWHLPASTTLAFSTTDFGSTGSILGGATFPRIAISTTFSNYTPPIALLAGDLHFFVEIT